MLVRTNVNGEWREADVWPGSNLLYLLREHLGLPGSKNACEQGECGSCSVWLDGELVCAGTAAPTEHGLLLYGGATLARARGRGAYRALIRARWDDAVARGTPALITQGGSMSRPILERVGFERVGEVHMLMDRFDP